MRSFAGFYFILRYLLLFSDIHSSSHKFMSSPFSFVSILFTVSAIVMALTRPYKRMYMNVLDTLLLSLTAILCHLLSTEPTAAEDTLTTSIITLIPATVFWIYIISIIIYKVYKCCFSRRKTTVTTQDSEVTRYGSIS